MDVYGAIAARRTVRDFEDRAVPGEVLERILGAGLQAPTNDHLRQWEFVVVGDRARREELLRVRSFGGPAEIDGWLDGWGAADAAQRGMYHVALPRQYSMLYGAGALILPFFRVHTPLLRPENLSSLNAFASIWCCIENILLAAAAEGIFGVTRIPLDGEAEHVKAVVGHPDDYVLPCYIALGYPAEGAGRVRQNRVDVKGKMHRDVW